MIAYKGKRLEELSHEEAVECAMHFYEHHRILSERHEDALRRMREMERALTPAQIKKLDWWLSKHPHACDGATEGDGSLKWPMKWVDFWPAGNTYKTHGDTHV